MARKIVPVKIGSQNSILVKFIRSEMVKALLDTQYECFRKKLCHYYRIYFIIKILKLNSYIVSTLSASYIRQNLQRLMYLYSYLIFHLTLLQRGTKRWHFIKLEIWFFSLYNITARVQKVGKIVHTLKFCLLIMIQDTLMLCVKSSKLMYINILSS